MHICNMFFYQVSTLTRCISTAIFSIIGAIQKCICPNKNKTYDLIHLPQASASQAQSRVVPPQCFLKAFVDLA